MDTLKQLINKYSEKFSYLILLGLTFLFPLNQQLHIKPYPSVDGFIIDYLIIKISIPEVLLFLLTLIQINKIWEFLKKSRLYLFTAVSCIFFFVTSTIFSNYRYLSLYENTVILLLILNLPPLIDSLRGFKLDLFTNSVKIWLILLSILGFSQFLFQKSVLNNYPLYGEFPYSEDYYHIKQKGFLFEDLIPPYAIFSHSNIFGGFVLLSIMYLGVVKKDSNLFHSLALILFLIIGSMNILLCYLLWLSLTKISFIRNFKIRFAYILVFLLLLYFLQMYLSLNYQSYSGNYSLYRRLYMFDLSLDFFIRNPITALSSGYYNYFSIVKDSLYTYEIVRFFQPPHNLFNLIVWQYGIFFLIGFLVFLNESFKKLPQDLIKVTSIILIASMFDHFFLTNHQLKFFIFLLIPYSLIAKNSI